MGTLWYGGNIYSLLEENHKVEALYTKGNRIVAVGTFADLKERFHQEIDSNIHLNGETMLPGFVDSHMHLIGYGEKLNRLDLTNCQSKEEALQAVKQYSSTIEKGEWIIGDGWNENLWGPRATPIFKYELDTIVPDHPVFLKRVCRHALVANSKALEAANINENTANPEGGVIGRDENGRLNGLLKEEAQELLYRVLPEVSAANLKSYIRRAIQSAYKLGLTGVHTEDLSYFGGYERTLQAFKDVIEEEGYPFRAHLLVHHLVVDDMKEAGESFLSGSEWIEFGAMKIFADGSLGSSTALLSHPYADDPSTSGVAIFSQDQLDELVKKAREYELPVAVHAIGDLAFEMVLNAIEKFPLRGVGRDRLIHAQILRMDLINRAKMLPLILDIQPRFLASDFPWVMDRVGEKQDKFLYAWRTLLKEGLSCAGGSDAPIEPLSPLLGIHAAVTRTNVNDSEKTVYFPEEALSVFEAVSLFTKGSAYAACHENDRGLIKEGFLADFTIFKEDIFNIDLHSIPHITVSKTIIGGKIVFDSSNK
ncbi:amidohydrolase [Bacillus sp. DTU_2020_1000418_1_SI_GHA_SEK_038]|uniref:amidohydrolase n=1 Tax=Bacillus sp. DTU_2020_1000418_1_SI_GHA_SEK_038 TaxID=3077585 RepID=UPI0028E54BE9|nr:amidohydrolase [Bacillus sp. DTU_2020_1000418_1_SI_GHA_SEK_038]WNS74602.1 amidohydrolase [Bacillus sp. DTU_2020_1000418_1_SI_GHA_SEK_038]